MYNPDRNDQRNPTATLPDAVTLGDQTGHLSPEKLRRKISACPSPGEVLDLMKGELTLQRQYFRSRFLENRQAERLIHDLSNMMDALIRGSLDFAASRLYRVPNPTVGEEFALVAVGGYGRGELAPGSDIDLLFIHPYKRTPHVEQMAEFLLYKLWDLDLKVGQSLRSLDETVKLARHDLTIETSLLETRLIWGSNRLFDTMCDRVRQDVFASRGADFIEGKLAERDARHARTGDTRFHLEPNVKEGKGGLRDLQTLMWLGRHLYGAKTPEDLVTHGMLSQDSLKIYKDARRFLWSVRCHLHYLTGRTEERLTFDLQPIVAAALNYQDRQRALGVERFMKRYYLVLKNVGALTRIVCAALEEQHKRRPRFGLPRFGLGRRRLGDFIVVGGRLNLRDPMLFQRDPARMLALFSTSQQEKLDIHPDAMTAVTSNLPLVDRAVRADAEANRHFMNILTGKNDPSPTLVRMNETGLLGKFVPDFGKIVALMQHNLYHAYTVDEHTIKAIHVLSQIENGELDSELPLSSGIIPSVQSRAELYVAMFIHDLGKGRGGDHSTIGADIARRLCPRLGMGTSATETVSWLVQQHLFMSATAFKRDLDDPQTIRDFIEVVQSPERLKLLLLLTVADIRAVGPNIWNGWKGQLLRELYAEAEAALNSTDKTDRRRKSAEIARENLVEQLVLEGWSVSDAKLYQERHDPRYWLSTTEEEQLRHAALVRHTEEQDQKLGLGFAIDHFNARTELTVYAADHPGLFMKLAGALAVSGTSIVDARIFTTHDGMALDSIGLQDGKTREAVTDPDRLDRVKKIIYGALQGELWLEKELEGRSSLPSRADVFQVEPRIFINNSASSTHTLIEVNGRDRPGLLFDVTKALKNLGLSLNSAHVSTYGERVVDVFYVKDVFGMKIQHPGKQKRITERLSKSLAGS